MKFNLTSTDKDGIITSIEFESELNTESDLEDVFVKLLKFFKKSGAKIPSEIEGFLNG